MTKSRATSNRFIVVGNKHESPWMQMMAEALAPLGELCFATENEALTQVGEQKYDLIIIASGKVASDLGVLVKQFRDAQPDSPIVVTTTSPTWRRAREVFMAGGTEYIRRTLDKEKIYATYAEILKRSQKEFNNQ